MKNRGIGRKLRGLEQMGLISGLGLPPPLPPPPYADEGLVAGLDRMQFSNGTGESFKKIKETEQPPPPAPPPHTPAPPPLVPLEKASMMEYLTRVTPGIAPPPPPPPSYKVANGEKRDLRLFYAGPLYHTYNQHSRRSGVVVQRAAELFKEEVRLLIWTLGLARSS